jgi:glycogen debranching enzyme
MLPFQHITPQGRLPDSMTRNELLYDFTKPPVYGWTFFKLLNLLNPDSSESDPIFTSIPKDRLTDIHAKISLFTRYWYLHRATPMSAIPYYSHGNDSGWDNATGFDSQTVCISPDLPAFLVVQCDFLVKLGGHLGVDVDEWVERRDTTLEAMIEELWDGSCFKFKDAIDGSTWGTTTLLQYIPLIAASHLPKDIVSKMASSLQPYLSEWGLATERLDSELYESDGYWRGPIWAPPTLLIESGLRSAGHLELADTIRERYIKLCSKNGFAENYDALEGKGNRDLSYTWAASAYLTMRYEQNRD